jgi:hypothetical protein
VKASVYVDKIPATEEPNDKNRYTVLFSKSCKLENTTIKIVVIRVAKKDMMLLYNMTDMRLSRVNFLNIINAISIKKNHIGRIIYVSLEVVVFMIKPTVKQDNKMIPTFIQDSFISFTSIIIR